MNWKLRKNLNKDLRIGELIDIEVYIKNNDIISLCQLLYRDPINNSIPDLSEVQYNFILGTYEYYLKWRKGLFEDYAGLFSGGDESEEQKRKRYEKFGLKWEEDSEEQKAEKEHNSKWGWYSTLFENICNGDVLKMKEAYNLNVISTFTHLAYLTNKNK